MKMNRRDKELMDNLADLLPNTVEAYQDVADQLFKELIAHLVDIDGIVERAYQNHVKECEDNEKYIVSKESWKLAAIFQYLVDEKNPEAVVLFDAMKEKVYKYVQEKYGKES
jgi:hypothetical protein